MANSATGNEALIEQLVSLLEKGQAHVTFEDTIDGLELADLGVKPAALPYSIWRQVEHLRITQRDILDFSRDPSYQSPKWPDDYWPATDAPKNEQQWQDTIEQIKADRKAFIELLRAPNVDLYTPFPHGDGQNLLREALLIADHNSYHLGEILVLRRLLGKW